MPHYLCLVTAMTPLCGPPYLGNWETEEIVNSLVQEVHLLTLIDLRTLEDIITEVIQAIAEDDEIVMGSRYYALDGANDEKYFDVALVIGPQELTRAGHPEIRRVVDYGDDDYTWTTILDGESGRIVRRRANTVYGMRQGSPIFVWERPFLYLRDWLNDFVSSASFEDFALQFFRIVWEQRRVNGNMAENGLLNCIDYGGIEKSWETMGNGFQTSYRDCRMGVYHLAAAISEDKRGRNLWPAISRDFGVWMTVRPDIWPVCKQTPEPSIVAHHGNPQESHVFALPTELLLQVLAYVPLAGLMGLLATSRASCHMLNMLLDAVLLRKIRVGDLRWILPVGTVPGEVQRAIDALQTWFPEPESIPPTASPGDLLHLARFPVHAFVRECFAFSDSMRNRRRIWNIAQQYRELWLHTTL